VAPPHPSTAAHDPPVGRRAQQYVALTSFAVLFAIVGLALYGLPLYYDFMVTEFGWSRAQVTSGNALSKLVVGPVFGFIAGWIVDRFGPRRLMLASNWPVVTLRASYADAVGDLDAALAAVTDPA
jgi:MFS family permease